MGKGRWGGEREHASEHEHAKAVRAGKEKERRLSSNVRIKKMYAKRER